MLSKSTRRPSPALIVAITALVAALSGTAIALPGKNSVKSNDIQKNAVGSSDIKNNKVKGADVKESSLGQVPSAANADRAGSSASVDTVIPFSGGANEDSTVSLVKTAEYELIGICDNNADFAIPESVGVFDYNGSQLVGDALAIVRRGAAPALADSDDDADYRLDTGEAIAFNYDDNGDGGGAMDTAGHTMVVPSWSNLYSDEDYVDNPDASDDYPFDTDCHFGGVAFVG
jgi:hypothetical protein